MRLQTALFILSVASIGYGEPMQTSKNIHAMQTDQALSTLATYRTEREVAIQSLRDFFADKASVPKRPEVLIEVLNTAGSLRVNEVIPEIMDNITFQPIQFRDRPIGPEDYPAVKALIQIGFPAAKAVVERADKDQDQLALSLYAIVVKEVLGQEVGTSYIALLVKKNKNLKTFQIRYFPTDKTQEYLSPSE